MTIYWRIPISITLRAPWVTPGDAAPGPSTDIVLARNRQGQFILPAPLIKGNLRAAADQLAHEELIRQEVVNACFGTPSGRRFKGGTAAPLDPWRVANEPEPGALIFGDMVTEQTAKKLNGRTQRVEIDPVLGAALDGHLLFIECPFDFDEEVKFDGKVVLYATDEVAQEDARKLLELALGRLFAVGGMKSVGFGRVVARSIGQPVSVVPAQISAPASSLDLEYTIDRPFLVDAQRHSGNLVVGSSIIPGSAIKAVIARGCKAAGIEAEDFLSALAISHASPNGWKVLPLSLSVSGKTVFCNLNGETRDGFHKFSADWKDEEKEIRAKLGAGWEAPKIALSGRSRTAIDPGTLTSAYEAQEDGKSGAGLLFSQVSVVPDDLVWKGRIRAPDSGGHLAEILGLLKAGLPGLGKTGAILKGVASARQEGAVPNGGVLNLCLTSDACLFTPGQARSRDVGALYREYFDHLGFELQTWFASQYLKGGYLALRYPAEADKYSPWVLTRAGSVFRVKPRSDADVADIVRKGLPPAKGLSTDWREFPFLRENGFAQVIGNILDHENLAAGIEL